MAEYEIVSTVLLHSPKAPGMRFIPFLSDIVSCRHTVFWRWIDLLQQHRSPKPNLFGGTWHPLSDPRSDAFHTIRSFGKSDRSLCLCFARYYISKCAQACMVSLFHRPITPSDKGREKKSNQTISQLFYFPLSCLITVHRPHLLLRFRFAPESVRNIFHFGSDWPSAVPVIFFSHRFFFSSLLCVYSLTHIMKVVNIKLAKIIILLVELIANLQFSDCILAYIY